MPTPCPVTYKGETYPTQAAAAKAAGVAKGMVGYHLDRHGNLDKLGVGSGNGGGQRQVNNKEVTLLGRDFHSIADAARFYGVGRTTAFNAINGCGTALQFIAKKALEKDAAEAASRHRANGHQDQSKSQRAQKGRKKNEITE